MNPFLPLFYKKPVIFIIFVMASSLPAIGQLAPIPLTAASFNQDVVAESGSDPQTVTTAAIDGTSGNYILYSVAFQAANSSVLTSAGMPNSGTLTNSGNTWQLQSYSANNCLLFNPQTATTTQTMYLSTPKHYTQVSLLDCAGYGPTSVTITLNYSDGSSTNYGTFSVLDWFGGTPYIADSLGRISRSATVSNNSAPTSDPRLYQTAISLNSADELKVLISVSITDNSTNDQATAAFFALSGIDNIALDLDQTSLSGQYQSAGNSVLLNWNAVNTTNTQQFDVQRSVNGTDFTTIGSANAEITAGESIYSYSDNTVVKGQSYFYRILEDQSGGTSDYSNIVEIRTAATASYTVSSTAGTIYVNNSQYGLATQYEIFSASGQLCLKGLAPAASQFTIDAHYLARGVYIIRLGNEQQTQSMEFLR